MNVTVTRSPRSPTLITTKARSSLVSPWSFGPKKKRELYRDDQAAPLSCPASTAPQSPLDELPASRRRPTAFRTESPSNQQRRRRRGAEPPRPRAAQVTSGAAVAGKGIPRWETTETLARMERAAVSLTSRWERRARLRGLRRYARGGGVIRSGAVASGDSSGRRGAAVPVAGSPPYAQATRGQHQCRQ